MLSISIETFNFVELYDIAVLFICFKHGLIISPTQAHLKNMPVVIFQQNYIMRFTTPSK